MADPAAQYFGLGTMQAPCKAEAGGASPDDFTRPMKSPRPENTGLLKSTMVATLAPVCLGLQVTGGLWRSSPDLLFKPFHD